MASLEQTEEAFSKQVLHLRAEYEQRGLATNLFPPAGRPCLELDVQRVGNKRFMTLWFEDGTENGQSMRIFDVPVPPRAISYASSATCPHRPGTARLKATGSALSTGASVGFCLTGLNHLSVHQGQRHPALSRATWAFCCSCAHLSPRCLGWVERSIS